jgi:hypothetical protein
MAIDDRPTRNTKTATEIRVFFIFMTSPLFKK